MLIYLPSLQLAVYSERNQMPHPACLVLSQLLALFLETTRLLLHYLAVLLLNLKPNLSLEVLQLISHSVTPPTNLSPHFSVALVLANKRQDFSEVLSQQADYFHLLARRLKAQA